jgi:hypothetical protein
VWLLLLLAVGAVAPSESRVRISIRDGGQPTGVRLRVTDAAGIYFAPLGHQPLAEKGHRTAGDLLLGDGPFELHAYVHDGAHTDVMYALSPAQAASTTPITPSVAAEADTKGTGSFAVGSGWVIGKGYDADETAPVWAHAYDRATLGGVGNAIDRAIVSTSPIASLSMFSDPRGHLWVAVEDGTSASLVELSKR